MTCRLFREFESSLNPKTWNNKCLHLQTLTLFGRERELVVKVNIKNVSDTIFHSKQCLKICVDHELYCTVYKDGRHNLILPPNIQKWSHNITGTKSSVCTVAIKGLELWFWGSHRPIASQSQLSILTFHPIKLRPISTGKSIPWTYICEIRTYLNDRKHLWEHFIWFIWSRSRPLTWRMWVIELIYHITTNVKTPLRFLQLITGSSIIACHQWGEVAFLLSTHQVTGTWNEDMTHADVKYQLIKVSRGYFCKCF